MQIDHVHFYIEDAHVWRDWFVRQLGFEAVGGGVCHTHTLTEAVKNGSVYFLLSSPLLPISPVAEFLRSHPPGVADVAFRVRDLPGVMAKAVDRGAKVLQPIQEQKAQKWGKIKGWGDLSHTLIERTGKSSEFSVLSSELTQNSLRAGLADESGVETEQSSTKPAPTTQNSAFPVTFLGIDHVVMNVAAGDLERAVNWYEKVLGFQRQQTFDIQTERSALHSTVLLHPSNSVQFPINEPASTNSQIQEFLDMNRGSGIQHIALQTPNLVESTQKLRAAGLPFLQVPPTYYTQLQQRRGLPIEAAELQQIASQQILVDWQQDIVQAGGETAPLLLQIFTEPIFVQPTFFFELIERRVCYVNGQPKQAQGFGEGNFRALFEAIEQEQMKRGSL